MALSAAQGFETFLTRLTPLGTDRAAKATHRASVESSLSNALDVSQFRETGSFTHGTGVRGHCDVDLMVSLKGGRPDSSDSALRWVKEALAHSFNYTAVRVSRPAVVVEFAGGNETWEVIPSFMTGRGGQGVFVYDIPGPQKGWIDTAPGEHLAYVNLVNTTDNIQGGAKKLARLAKAWKYYNEVPISSFYLEMRAAKYMSGESSYIAIWDVCRLFEQLERIGLAAMNDPTGAAAPFYPCSTQARWTASLSKIKTAASRARKALNSEQEGDYATAFYYLDLLFGGTFPAR